MLAGVPSVSFFPPGGRRQRNGPDPVGVHERGRGRSESRERRASTMGRGEGKGKERRQVLFEGKERDLAGTTRMGKGRGARRTGRRSNDCIQSWSVKEQSSKSKLVSTATVIFHQEAKVKVCTQCNLVVVVVIKTKSQKTNPTQPASSSQPTKMWQGMRKPSPPPMRERD